MVLGGEVGDHLCGAVRPLIRQYDDLLVERLSPQNLASAAQRIYLGTQTV